MAYGKIISAQTTSTQGKTGTSVLFSDISYGNNKFWFTWKNYDPTYTYKFSLRFETAYETNEVINGKTITDIVEEEGIVTTFASVSASSKMRAIFAEHGGTGKIVFALFTYQGSTLLYESSKSITVKDNYSARIPSCSNLKISYSDNKLSFKAKSFGYSSVSYGTPFRGLGLLSISVKYANKNIFVKDSFSPYESECTCEILNLGDILINGKNPIEITVTDTGGNIFRTTGNDSSEGYLEYKNPTLSNFKFYREPTSSVVLKSNYSINHISSNVFSDEGENGKSIYVRYRDVRRNKWLELDGSESSSDGWIAVDSGQIFETYYQISISADPAKFNQAWVAQEKLIDSFGKQYLSKLKYLNRTEDAYHLTLNNAVLDSEYDSIIAEVNRITKYRSYMFSKNGLFNEQGFYIDDPTKPLKYFPFTTDPSQEWKDPVDPNGTFVQQGNLVLSQETKQMQQLMEHLNEEVAELWNSEYNDGTKPENEGSDAGNVIKAWDNTGMIHTSSSVDDSLESLVHNFSDNTNYETVERSSLEIYENSSDCNGECAGLCTSGCYGTCVSSCATACSFVCSSSCVNSCSSDCSDSCAGDCIGSCVSGCSNTCKTSCGSDCTSSCSGACLSSCKNGCSTTCKGTCDSSCKDGCSSKCKVGCEQNCVNMCNTKCSGSCGKECTSNCLTSCEDNCYNSCSEGCQLSCSGSCNVSCKSSCKSSCSGCSSQCKNSCTGLCLSSCSGGCVGNCAGSCSAVCTALCSGGCNNSCTGACVGNCSSGCLSTCGGNCGSSCRASCSASCWNTCSGCYTTCANSCVGHCYNVCDSQCSGDCVQKCKSSCFGSCLSACTTACAIQCTSCANSCSGKCLGTCTGTCSGSCSQVCRTSCSASCFNSCSGVCGDMCTNSCKQECGNNCSGQCENSCSSCSSKCSVSCSGQCKDRCQNSCNTVCATNCNSKCITSCSGSCYNTCGNGCSSTCKNACKINCSIVCSQNCGSDCSGSCGESCYSDCSGKCSENCTSACKQNCAGVCRTACSSSCGGMCTDDCSDGCTSSCSGSCNTKCSAQCISSCSTTCNSKCQNMCFGCTGNMMICSPDNTGTDVTWYPNPAKSSLSFNIKIIQG